MKSSDLNLSIKSWKQLWIKTVAPNEPHKFERRLQRDELSENDFYDALNSEPDLSCVDLHSAHEILKEAVKSLKSNWNLPLLPVNNSVNGPFVDLWWPIRCYSAERLKQILSSSSSTFNEDIFYQLADSLLDRLCQVGDQVLWQVFNEERTPGTMLLAHLGEAGNGSGPPTREYYERFIQFHRRNGLSKLFYEFPVFERHIRTVISLWFQGSTEMLQRICDDRTILQHKFAIPSTYHLKVIKQGLSDPHRGGRAVAILEFAESNSYHHNTIKVVYKPKDMGVDQAYQSTLADLNANSDLTPLRTLTIHSSMGYGYMEFVNHRLCADDKELASFYWNAGRLTALLHLLGCTDCHHENLIACGDQLILIDTETLLEADLPDHISEADSTKTQLEPSTLQLRLKGSVLRSGLLPQWMFTGESKQAIDISALGITPPRKTEAIRPGWLGLNSDGMMRGFVSEPNEIPTSLPVGVGDNNPFDRYLDDFCNGFRAQNQIFINIRSRWLGENGMIAHFAGHPRRIVLRATRVYFAIQRQQLEPAALRSSIAQAIKLEQLARSFLMAESNPDHWPIYAAEVEQMQHLDIPLFTHLMDHDAIQLGRVDQVLPGFIQTSGLNAVYDRLRNLDANETAFQLRLIHGAAEARQLDSTIRSSTTLNKLEKGEKVMPSKPEDSLKAAKRICQRLLELAIQDSHGQVEWLGIELGDDGVNFGFGPVGLSLYGGAIAIANFLQRLDAQNISINNGDAIRDAILEPLRVLVEQSSEEGRLRWWRDLSLGINGCGGILLALELQGERQMTDRLLASALPQIIEADQQLDVIGGCAGLIGSLLRLKTETAQQLALRAGDHLVATQNKDGAWDSPLNEQPLLGFSHGTAGFSAALARLHLVTGEERYRKAAAAALAYERERFCPDQGNWPDYRNDFSNTTSDQTNFMVSWCHGAPGIALGRACLWGTSLWDEQCAEEIRVGLQTTAASPAVANDHLCCGSLGLMVLLEMLSSGPWLIDNQLKSYCQDVADQHRQRALLRCSDQSMQLRCFGTKEASVALPGFFTGLSGMGLALLEDHQSQNTVYHLVTAGLWPEAND